MKLHHVGYAVRDIGRALQRLLAEGAQVVSDRVADPIQNVFVQFVSLPETSTLLELVAPLSEPSPIDGCLERGGGLYHLCFEVDSLEGRLAREQQNHATVVASPVEAAAFGGRRVAFVLRRSGLLVEFVESARSAGQTKLSRMKQDG